MAEALADGSGVGTCSDWIHSAVRKATGQATAVDDGAAASATIEAVAAAVAPPALVLAPDAQEAASALGARPSLFTAPVMPRVSVVIPALNEEQNLPHVLPAIPTWVHEVVLVDGRSTDRSIEVARSLRPDVRIVTQRGKGKGDALRAGFAAAEGDIIVMLDADGSTDPHEIPAFVGALLTGADFAKGSRFMQGGGTEDMTLVRRVGHGMLVQLVRLAFGCNYSDLCYGYNAFWSCVLPHLDLDADGFEIETLMNVRALRADLKIVEVHSFEGRRIHGESHLRAIPDGFRVLTTILKERLGLGQARAEAPAAPHRQGFWANLGLATRR